MELKIARKLLRLIKTIKTWKEQLCLCLKPMSDSDSSENELLKLNDDEDNGDTGEIGGEEFVIPNPENINIRDFL